MSQAPDQLAPRSDAREEGPRLNHYGYTVDELRKL